MNSYFFRVKISWKSWLWRSHGVWHSFDLLFFSLDDEKTFTDSQNEFVEQTEQLIVDLSKKRKSVRNP